jgi:hypothetical protein
MVATRTDIGLIYLGLPGGPGQGLGPLCPIGVGARLRSRPALPPRIADGTYPPGSRVTGIVELSAGFGIAANTAQKALAHRVTRARCALNWAWAPSSPT